MSRLMVPAGVGMIAVTFGLARYGYGLLLPDMRADLELSATAAGTVGAGVYVAYLAANTLVVPLTNRFGARLPLLLATLSAAAGMAMTGAAQGVWTLAAGVAVAGLAAGFAFPPYADLVARAVAPRRQAVAWAAISSGTGWGVALAGPLAVLSGAGWRTCWLVFAGIAVVLGLLAVRSAPGGSGEVETTVRLSPSWFVCPRSMPLLAGAVLVGAGSSVWWAFSVDAMQAAGTEPVTSRLLYAWCGAASLLASFTGAVVAQAGQRGVHRWSTLLLGGSLLLLALTSGFGGAGSPTVVALAVAAGLFGTSYNAVIAVQGLWSAEVFASRPSAGLAGVNTALTAGTVLGPWLGGAVIDGWGYGPALAAAGACAWAATLLAPPLAGRRPRQGSTQVPVS